MVIALTANGPGEVAGWLRPLLRSLYRRCPDLLALVFLVPDDFATGFERNRARRLSSGHRLRTEELREVCARRKARRRSADVDIVQYVGGDLLHAARVHARLKGAPRRTILATSLSQPIRSCLCGRSPQRRAARGVGDPERSIEQVGNLAIDGALFEPVSLWSRARSPTASSSCRVRERTRSKTWFRSTSRPRYASYASVRAFRSHLRSHPLRRALNCVLRSNGVDTPHVW